MYPEGSVGSSIPVRELEIPRKIGQLRNELESLEIGLAELEKRLAPVCTSIGQHQGMSLKG